MMSGLRPSISFILIFSTKMTELRPSLLEQLFTGLTEGYYDVRLRPSSKMSGLSPSISFILIFSTKMTELRPSLLEQLFTG
jgi:hypothetical protein